MSGIGAMTLVLSAVCSGCNIDWHALNIAFRRLGDACAHSNGFKQVRFSDQVEESLTIRDSTDLDVVRDPLCEARRFDDAIDHAAVARRFRLNIC